MNVHQFKPNGPRKKMKRLILTTRDKLRMSTSGRVHDSLDKLFGKTERTTFQLRIRGSYT